jgi:multiple sugar transport system permease protein
MSLNVSPTTQASAGHPVALTRRRGIGFFQLSRILTTLVAALLALLFLWPFFCMVGWSFNRIDVLMNPLWPVPAAFTTTLYELMLTRYGFQNYILNSVSVVTAMTVFGTLASALAGYALAKLRFPGRNLLFLLILGIMLLPTQTMLVPRFIVLRQLGLINNYWGLILPAVGGGAFGIFLMRQFMLSVPTEMMEAGRMDGCNEFSLFWQVVLPTMKAAVLVLATLSLRGAWNELLWPQVIITDEAKQLLMPAIARLNNLSVADVYARPVVIAASIVAAVVPLALYAYSQRHFVATLTGAVKG